MRINKNHILLTALFFILIFQNLETSGQPIDLNTDSSDNQYYREKLFIDTDREIYITSEQIWLKVFNLNALSGTPAGLSKIVNLELIDGSGNPVNQVRMMVEGSSGSSGFRLSDTLKSGNYLLRAYTSWMRNFGEDQFSYKSVTIINPFKNIGDLADSVAGHPDNPDSGYSESGNHANSGSIEDQIITRFNPDKEKYRTRERVKADIVVTDAAGNAVDADLSVSVVKSFLAGNDRKFIIGTSTDPGLLNNPTDPPAHLPELEGELIRGTISNKITGEPLREIDISLSFVGKTARCQFMKTNSEGGFIFVVKEQTQPGEIVIQPLSGNIPDSYVELDWSFSDSYNGYKPVSFSMDSAMAEEIDNAVISMQVNNIYEQERITKDDSSGIELQDFFGAPVRRIYLDDFIELTDIREVVKELLPEVILFRKDKTPALKVVSSNPYQIFEDQALVLFDGVPVTDIENLLEVSSNELERIDIVTSRYFYSDYFFDGIISFVSKRGDLSALNNGSSLFRQVFEGSLGKKDFYQPDYSIDSIRLSRIPDYRNTLYWNADITTPEDGVAEIEFYTSDEGMEYLIIVEGFTSGGKKVYNTFPLSVN